MKKIILITLVGTVFAVTSALACDTCAAHAKKAEGEKMVCSADCDKPCCAEKKACAENCDKPCCAEKKADTAAAATAPCCEAVVGKAA